MRPGSAAYVSRSRTRGLADGDRTDTGHHLPLRQMTVMDHALVAVLCLQTGMLAEKVCHLGLDRSRQQRAPRCAGFR
jgi:hypothetical protein